MERTTEIYGDSMSSLGISEETNLMDANGKEIMIGDFLQGDIVSVTLKDSFTEETLRRCLDMMMSDINGFQVLQKVRGKNNVPVLSTVDRLTLQIILMKIPKDNTHELAKPSEDY